MKDPSPPSRANLPERAGQQGTEHVAAWELLAPHLTELLGPEGSLEVHRGEVPALDAGVRAKVVRDADGAALATLHLRAPTSPADRHEAERLRERLTRLSSAIEQAEAELAHMERLDRRLLARRTSMDALLDDLLESIVARLPHARAAVALAAPRGTALRIAAHRDLPADAIGIRLDAGEGPVGQTLRSGAPRAYPARRFELAQPEGTTVTVVPLLPPRDYGRQATPGDASGAILLATPEDQPLRGADLEFLRRVGVHGAVLIESARMLEHLRASEQTYRTMVERAHLGMALLDGEGRVRHSNGPMQELLGENALPGVPFRDHVAPACREDWDRHLERGGGTDPVAPLDLRLRPSGEEVLVRLSVAPIRERPDHASAGYVVMARDLRREHDLESERRAMERRVQQAEKLSAVGKFVAGIAHELNNPLTVVIGYAELLAGTAGLPDRIMASLEQVLLHARRCGRIVDDLLKFAHHERTRPEAVHLAAVIHEAVAATRLQEREDIELSLDVPTCELPPIVGSPHALCQLVTNVLDNAIDAVRLVSDRPRRIRVVLRREDGSQSVAVEDHGPGIAEPERVFDPFYTTKPIGKGTGLGLSICYGIARDHDGDLYAENRAEGGARILIVLPEGREPEAELPALAGLDTGGQLSEADDGTRPRLLVVDDEPAILELAREALERYCDVTTADNVEAALQALDGGGFDIVLTDLRIPAGLTGADFYEIIAERWPDLTERVAFMTGDTVGQASQAFLDRVRRPCLAKPFKIGQLVAFVRALG